MRILVVLAALMLTACDRIVAPPASGPGGMLVLEVNEEQLQAQRLRELSQAIREELRKSPLIPIAALGGRKVEGDHVAITLADAGDAEAATGRIKSLGSVATANGASGAIEVRLTEDSAKEDQLNKDLVAAVKRRIAEAGFRSAVVETSGRRIVARIPGLSDPEKLASLGETLAFSGDLSFHLVDEGAIADDYVVGVEKNGRIALPDDSYNGVPLVVMADAIVTGEDLASANQVFDQMKQPSIAFQLKPDGARRFGQATTENIGRRFAIVLGDRIVTAPNIRSPITSGLGTIEGGFTIERAKEMALVLRSGALPAPLRLIQANLYVAPPEAKKP